MAGLRVHVTGSAAADCNRELLEQAHICVARLTEQLITRGYGLVVGFGGEPTGDAGLPCVFDWTALAAVADTADHARTSNSSSRRQAGVWRRSSASDRQRVATCSW